MKKANLTIIATIIAAFGITMFAFQSTTEAGNSVLPSATPSPRKIRKIPAPTPSPITKIKARKTSVREGGANNTTHRTRQKNPTGLVYNESLKEIRAKQPRKRSTQKRQHMPCKDGDCK